MGYLEENIKLYQEKNNQYGEGAPENLWRRQESQLRRFVKFKDLIDFNDKNILDVGCGYGDFYNFLVNKSVKPKAYIGCDLMSSHCKVAREKLPDHCQIYEGDFLQIDLPQVDVAILSGTLNAEFEDWERITCSIMDKMWLLSSEVIAFNMQSLHGLNGEYKQKVLTYRNINPGYWVEYAHKKTCKYGLYHDYMHYDYTVCMWKADLGWQEN